MNCAKSIQPSFVPFVLVLALALAITLLMIAPFLIPVVMGGISAVLVYPLYRRALGRGLSPLLSAAAITLSVIILIVGPALTLVVLSVKQASVIAEWVATAQIPTLQELMREGANWGIVSALGGTPESLEQGMRSLTQAMSRFATTTLLRLASEVPHVALQMTLSVLAGFFFLMDGARAVAWIASLIPMNRSIQNRIRESFRDTAISVIWASMAAAATQAGIMLLAFGVLDIPAAFLAGGATFIFAWIPLLGSFPVWGSGILYLVLQGSLIKAAILLGIGIFTAVIDNFIRPLVLKGRSEMHPMVSLIAIFGGLEMFGIVGVFFGPILMAIMLTLLQIWPVMGKDSGLEFPAGDGPE